MAVGKTFFFHGCGKFFIESDEGTLVHSRKEVYPFFRGGETAKMNRCGVYVSLKTENKYYECLMYYYCLITVNGTKI